MAMPRSDGILETALYVEDLDRAARFYRTIFGFETFDSSERLHALAVGPRQVLLLFKKGASATRMPGDHNGDGRLHLAFAIPFSELGAWEEWLGRHGIPVEEKRAWERGGYSLYFRDPDEHLIEVATPGVWSIY
jgi:catechol 2,3-dioxygenase-like lactoylglutathione lyase family enzyme